MSALFLNILNLAINASWLILAVIVARMLMKKAPKWTNCLLWGMVAIRLICPFSLESAMSLLPSGKVVPENIVMEQQPHIDSGLRIIDNAVNPVIESTFSPSITDSVNPMQVVVAIAAVVWVIGMFALLLYAFASFVLLKRKVRASLIVSGKVRECDEVSSPFILGIIRPVIYVPSGMNDKTLELVIAHEEAHLKRHDHWWKPLGFVLLSVYWFNPLCWIAYILLCRDIEAACDEKVVRNKDRDYIASYSQALLDCSSQRRVIAACPLAFGETGVKQRVKGVLNYKKPTFWVVLFAVIICIIVIICFLTSPKSSFSVNPDRIDRINVFDGTNGEGIDVSDEEEILRIVNYINNMRLNRDKLSVGYMGYGFRLTFYSDGRKVEDFILNSSTIVRKDPFFYTLQEETGLYDYLGSLYNKDSSNTDMNTYEIDDSDDAVLEYSNPVVILSDLEGSDLTELLYADNDRIIFSGYYGLFIYSKGQRAITNAIDLEPIGCNYTQGDNYCEKFVSADGNTVYLHPVSNIDMYVYDILSDTLSQQKYDLEGRELHALQHNEEGEIFDVWNSDDRQIETHLHHGSFIGELGYIEHGQSSADKVIPYYPLFSPDGLSGAVDFVPEDVHDIVAADIWVAGELSHMPGVFDIAEGQSRRLHCEDQTVLKELGKAFSEATKENTQTGCPFYTALYLTRSDGTIGMVFPATDSCDMYVSGKECYRMAEGTNEKLWGMINGFQEIDGQQEDTNNDNSENMSIQYTFEDGSYVVDGRGKFQYKKELIGRSPNAKYDTRFIVLTNDPDITFEKVDRSLWSSNSADWPSDTIIIGMGLDTTTEK